MALHLLEGAGPPEPDRYTIFILLVREVGWRARLPSFRGANIVVRRLPACGARGDGAAAGVARLFIRWLARRGEARLRFGARLPSQNGFSSGPLVSGPLSGL